jgi:nucleoside-diphosphate-sugar epimerase
MGETLDILILRCGYTGQRVAKRFLAMGASVTATTRNPQRLAEEPCTSRDIAEFCAKLLNVPVTGTRDERPHRMPRFANNRRVDGSAIQKALGITLTYPSRRVGIPAAISGETTAESAGCQQL